VTETRTGTATSDRVPPKPVPATAGGRGGRRRGPYARLSLFLREVAAELRKVIWPTRGELVTYTLVVLIFVSAMVAIVAGMDIAFGKGVLAIFG
jgi:preprotein translocase subunit SecE